MNDDDAGDLARQRALVTHLETYLTPRKVQRIDAALAWRTRFVTVVVENMGNPRNAAAVVRTCDSFGVQEMHFIEEYRPVTVSDHVVVGADQWVTRRHYRHAEGNNTVRCLTALRDQGYWIVAATLRPNSRPIRTLDVSRPLALLFGSEEIGLSDTAHDLADEQIVIPMVGLTQSLNVSVSAGICLYDVMTRLHAERNPDEWRLSGPERVALKLAWLKQQIRGGETIAQRFLNARDG